MGSIHFKADTILQNAQKAYNISYNISKSATDCPSDEMLLDYLDGILSENEKEKIDEHIQRCERCHVEILTIEADYTEWEYTINKDPDAALAKALGDIENSELKIPEILEIIKDYYNIIKDAKKNYNKLISGNACPSDEKLLDYVEDCLSEDERGKIDEHIQKCERCHVEALKMEADFTEWEYILNKNPDAALAKALGTSGMKKILKKSPWFFTTKILCLTI